MTDTIRLTTAQALVKFIQQQYLEVDGLALPFVEGVFNILGHGNALGLGQALTENPGNLAIYQGKNEQGMALAAIAFSKERLRRQIYAVTTSVGPGSANLVTAAGTALANHLPVLLLPGDTFASRQPDPVLQQIEHSYNPTITTNDALKAVTRYWDRIYRPEQLMSSLIQAFEVLTNPISAGPVCLCLPQDVQSQAYDYPLTFFQKRIHYFNRPKPTDRELTELVNALKTSQRPLLLVGGGAKYSGAREELIQLAETHQIPLVETQAGKSTVESSFPLNFGGLGVTGNGAANQLAKQADLVIGIGTRYSDFTTASKSLFDFENTRFINLNISRQQAYKLDAYQVIGDAKQTLQSLLPKLNAYRTSLTTELAQLRTTWQQERRRLAQISFQRTTFTPEIAEQFTQEKLNHYADSLASELTQTTALLAINKVLPPDSIIVGAAGSLPGDLQRLWESPHPNTYHLEYGYSCMGYEIAGSLGVKLAKPKQEVYAMVGDGSFLMLHTELVTSLQYGKKITILLFDNAGYGCINNLQMDHGSPSFQTEMIQVEKQKIMTLDYGKVAEGYGAMSYRVSTLEELSAAIKGAQSQSTSCLIDIKVLPKTMSHGYDAWWHVGVAEKAQSAAVTAAFEQKEEQLNFAKKY